jgi:hypothetical protein
LIKNGAEPTLIDNGINFSSRIAAGLINPLVFRRMTKSWRVDEFIPFLKDFYKELEGITDSKFFFKVPIRRLFSSEQERGFWIEKEALSSFKPYMHRINAADMQYSEAKKPIRLRALERNVLRRSKLVLNKHETMDRRTRKGDL